MDLSEYERRFRRSGLPLFIEDYSATHDVFTRATPLLALVFVAEMIGATSLDWSIWANLAAAAGGLAVLVGGFGILNGLRGRPFWSLPTRFGVPELAAFVLLPALLPLVFEGQLRQFFAVAAGNLLLLGVAYLVIGYGLVGTVAGGLHRLAGELASSLASMVRALPLLLVFSLVLFVNTEMWQVFSGMPLSFVILSVMLFSVLADAFLLIRLPGELARIEQEVGADPPLRRRERLNLRISLAVRQWLQVLVVGTGVGLFFIAFGMLAISSDIYESWGVDPGGFQVALELFDHEMLLSESLVKVATGIATFTSLYYSIALLTDVAYRAEYLDGIADELRDIFTVRSEYLRRRAQVSQSPSGPIAK